MNRFVLATLALALTAVVSGCNTIEGIGTDIRKAGQAIEQTATNSK